MRLPLVILCLTITGLQPVVAQPIGPVMINPVGGGAAGGGGAPVGPIGINSSIDDVLDALDLAGKGLKDFSADVNLAEADPITLAQTVQTGKVWFQNKADGNTRIRVVFDKKKLAKAVINEKREYLLDAGVLLDRNYRLQQEVQRQVVKPGEKINPLKLGEGTFPLPIGQSKEDVHKLFDVTKIAPDKDDPAGTVHLQLTPKPGTRYARKVKTMDLWVDPKNHMPVRIQTMNPNETTIQTTDLLNLKLNGGLGDDAFNLEKIGQNWSQRVEQLTD